MKSQEKLYFKVEDKLRQADRFQKRISHYRNYSKDLLEK